MRTAPGGWQTSGVTRFQSGAPYGIGYSVSGAGSDDPYNRLNAAMVMPPVFVSNGLESGVNHLDQSRRECLGSVAAEGVQRYGEGASETPRRRLQRVQPHAIQRHQQHGEPRS
jgi:hypothetical protein